MRKLLILIALGAGGIRAEFLHIEVFIRDMSCESCTESLSSGLKKIRGVDKVNVDFKAATVAVDLAAQNRVGVDQVWDAIKRVGFTPGPTKVAVRGTVRGQTLAVSEVNKTFTIEGTAPEGDRVELKGTTAPPPDPRTAVKIHVIE